MADSKRKNIQIAILEDVVCTLEVRFDRTGFNQRFNFLSLSASDLSICRSWSEAVDWSEVINGFCKNALSRNAEYAIANNAIFYYVIDDSPPALRMIVRNRSGELNRYAFSKLECLQIYSKMSKILSKCDLVAQEGY